MKNEVFEMQYSVRQQYLNQEKFKKGFDNEHISKRYCPGMECLEYYNEYINDTEKITTYNITEYGIEFEIKLICPTRIFENIMKNKSKIHILTNSVRTIAKTNNGNEIYVDEKNNELGFTMFCPNYYEWFQKQKWNNDVFVYIVTSMNMYESYKDFFPNFIYVIQPDITNILSYMSVGLTRFTALSFAKKIGLDIAFFLDDTIFDLKKTPNDIIQLKDIILLFEQLSTDAREPNVGYIGLCSSSFIGDTKWENNLKHTGQIIDTIQEGKIYDKTRIFNTKSWDELLQLGTDFSDHSFLNPHRPNFIVVNVSNVKLKNINYNPIHTIGEDIYFSKQLVLANLVLKQANVLFVRPSEKRRPKTCSLDGVCEIESALKSPKDIELFMKKDLDVIYLDFIMYQGRMIFMDKTGIRGASGTYGPIRFINANQKKSIENKIKKHPCLKKYMVDATVENITNSQLTYLHTNKYIYEDSDIFQILNIPFSTLSCKDNYKRICESIQHTFGLGGIEYLREDQTGKLTPSTGMYKYVKDYEYIESIIDMHINLYYKTDICFRNIVNDFTESISNELEIKSLECIGILTLLTPIKNIENKKKRYRIFEYLAIMARLKRIQFLLKTEPKDMKRINTIIMSMQNSNMYNLDFNEIVYNCDNSISTIKKKLQNIGRWNEPS